MCSPREMISPLDVSPLDMRITLWTKGGTFTFLPDVAIHGPILVPEHGVFITKAGSGKTGRAFAAELAATNPRSVLEQGKKINVKDAPTRFGPVAYEITSDADKGSISATIQMPARKPPQAVVLRFRHPTSAPIKGVTVNGQPWTAFNKEKETITLEGLTCSVAVTARYQAGCRPPRPPGARPRSCREITRARRGSRCRRRR